MFQSDKAVEYVSLSKVLQAQGIMHKFSCPHTHQQNGSIERKQRHIVEIGLTLLVETFLPMKFWGGSIHYCCAAYQFLANTLLNNQSPTKCLLSKKPPYESFRVFGCLCFPYTKPYNQHKLEFRSTTSVFLGYATLHKGYKCLTASGKVIISRHVLFDETKFSFKDPHSPFSHTTKPISSSTSIAAPSIPCLSKPPTSNATNISSFISYAYWSQPTSLNPSQLTY